MGVDALRGGLGRWGIRLFLSVCMVAVWSGNARAYEYAIGADVSFLKQAEDRGTEFKEDGVVKPGLRILRDHGYGWIRLRLFVNPDRLPNDLAYTIALAQDARKLGYKFLLDYHYSDTWADPGKQFTPAAWVDMTHEERVVAVREYTRDTISSFSLAGVLPEMVQIGNEVRPGMLWPDGRIPQNWDNFADYVRAGIAGVREGSVLGPMPKIMIHFDNGGSKEKLKYFFDKFFSYGIDIDAIGLSYYPWWHGTLLDLRESLYFLATTYEKDIVVVETAYHWTPSREAEQAGGAPFPQTPEGQREFLESVHEAVLSTPGGRGKGIFWWEPMVGGRGGLGGRSYFNGENEALPVITVFDKWARPPRTID
jgi:arabinogalactan endo-1,4-beta-galactosidase